MWPGTATEWAAVAALGLGPVGAAFFLWDIGVKRGDIRLLGVGSYAAPVLSTLFLVLAGYAEADARAWRRLRAYRGRSSGRVRAHDGAALTRWV